MSARVIINARPGAHPHLVDKPDGLYLVTPPTLNRSQRTGLLLLLDDRTSQNPAAPGLREVRQYVLDLGDA